MPDCAELFLYRRDEEFENANFKLLIVFNCKREWGLAASTVANGEGSVNFCFVGRTSPAAENPWSLKIINEIYTFYSMVLDYLLMDWSLTSK